MAYPAPFLEPLGESLGEQLAGQIPGVGQKFDVSTIAPQVAQINPFLQAAQQQAATQSGLGAIQFSPTTGAVTGIGQGTGIAAYQPYLDKAEALFDPNAYKQYMSPYQTEVIDATQQLLNEQRASGRSQLAANAIQSGAFGGGRSGVALAEYERGRDISDAATLAALRQQGLTSAQQLQQQGITNLTAMPTLQQGLQGNLISQLGLTGTGAQQYSQSLLDAVQQGNLMAQQFPYQQLQQQANVFSTLAGSSQGMQTQPMVTQSPALNSSTSFWNSVRRPWLIIREEGNMPNILRRPMFRGGKPNAYGTGITSNLESRRGFAEGPEEEMLPPNVKVDPAMREAYARNYGENIREQMTPSRQEQILDFLRAFGASAALPQVNFKPWGSALGKTGANFESIFGPKVQAARKAGTEGYLAALKGVDEKKLFLYQQKALDLYNSNRQSFPTYKDALNFVLQDEYKQKDTAAADIEKITQSYINQFNYEYGPAYARAFVDYQSN
jgi:hypothetical protein